MTIQIGSKWSNRVAQWEKSHEDPWNQKFHAVGVPMIASSIPLAMSVIGLPLAVPLFVAGWSCNFVGHAIEKKPPVFTEDKTALVTGFLWWLKRVGVVETRAAA